jgi:hypothetical protein
MSLPCETNRGEGRRDAYHVLGFFASLIGICLFRLLTTTSEANPAKIPPHTEQDRV